MYSRSLAYYSIYDIYSYVFPPEKLEISIEKCLPDKYIYFFNYGRDALYKLLLKRRKYTNKRYILIPGWGCPVILESVKLAGFIPILLDISPFSLKMNIEEIVYLNNRYDVDSVIIVAENGILYAKDEIKILKSEGLYIIADYCIAWQNLEKADTTLSDAEVFSGGFAKPISGVHLGIISTHNKIEGLDNLTYRINLFDLIKIVIHLALQNRIIYYFIKDIIDNYLINRIEHCNININTGTRNCGAVAIKSMNRLKNMKSEWVILQNDIISILNEHSLKSPVLQHSKYLQSKILFEDNLKSNKYGYKIHYHKQNRIDLLSDLGSKKIDSDYENIKNIKDNYISMSINLNSIKNSKNFIDAFRNDITL